MHIVAALVYNQPMDIVQFKLFQVGIPAEEVYAEVLPNHKKEQVAALQEDGSKVSHISSKENQ